MPSDLKVGDHVWVMETGVEGSIADARRFGGYRIRLSEGVYLHAFGRELTRIDAQPYPIPRYKPGTRIRVIAPAWEYLCGLTGTLATLAVSKSPDGTEGWMIDMDRVGRIGMFSDWFEEIPDGE